MRHALFAVTANGVLLARRAIQALDGEAALYCKAGLATDGAAHSFGRLSDAVAEAFSRYDSLIFVMAAGIAVRMVAPHVASKLSDPAVVVLDERGLHAISLLAGHIGGANVLARQLARALGADPVITTATDVENLLAVDALAAELALRPWPKDAIKELNSRLLAGAPIRYGVDMALPRAGFFCDALQQRGIAAEQVPAGTAWEPEGAAAFLTARRTEPRPGLLCLAPRRLIAGVGCRRGIPVDLVLDALHRACAAIGRDVADISLLASVDAKADETGLLRAAALLGKDVRFWSRERLRQVIEAYRLAESDFVRQALGIGNVCEAAALASVERGRVALGKTRFKKATVALVWER